MCILAIKANLWVIENALKLGVPLPSVTFFVCFRPSRSYWKCLTGKYFLQIGGKNYWARLQILWNHPVWFMMSFPLNLFQFYFRNLFHGGLFLLLGCIMFGWLLFQSFLLKICFLSLPDFRWYELNKKFQRCMPGEWKCFNCTPY